MLVENMALHDRVNAAKVAGRSCKHVEPDCPINGTAAASALSFDGPHTSAHTATATT